MKSAQCLGFNPSSSEMRICSARALFGLCSGQSLDSSLVSEGFPTCRVVFLTLAMDELLSKTHKLQVSYEDEWEVDKNLSLTIAKYNLRGRLCTNVERSRRFLKRVLGGIWRVKEAEWNIKIKDKFDSGLFLTFTFASESIQSRIISKMPWYLSNGLLILGKMENSNDSWKNDLTFFPIWGRALGVPVDFLTPKNTVRLAAMAGEVITVHNSDVSRMVANGYFRFQNDTRDGFQDRRLGQGNHITQGNKVNQEALGLAQGVKISNSFASLDETTTSVENLLIGIASKTESLKQNEAVGQSLMAQVNKEVPGGMENEVDKRLGDDGGRGKRRMVEDQGISWQGKLQKTINPSSSETQTHNLYNVPITYSQEIPTMEGPSSFVFGSILKNLSKENRRKRTNSDHYPLLLTASGSSPMTTSKIRWRTRFHFESAWADDEDCTRIVNLAWQHSDPIMTTRDLKGK
ncbi:hypothetical protein G4B88_024113 [Cannabis sativa]|uniref:DUF4283 domain-containing protein n=1 Tax=Cannabis sativa TaxID=3483 RepID=A0A7J6EGK2_CANSA|nr:hypothetical protein G4B88_024113 [Cannabis sativa]